MSEQQSYTLTGRVAERGQFKQVTEKFRTRELIIDTEGQYSQLVKFEFPNDQGNKLDTVNPGEMVTVHFNIRGRKVKDNYYNQLSGWKVERA